VLAEIHFDVKKGEYLSIAGKIVQPSSQEAAV
jgi:hypothetical protein